MVIQYPHKGKVFKAGESARDGNGNWIKSSLELIFDTKCRFEINSSNRYIIGADGKNIYFSCIVYMPLPVFSSYSEMFKPTPSQRIYSSETILYVVPEGSPTGEKNAVVDGLEGRGFKLKVDGTPLKVGEEYEVTESGFRLLGSASLIPGQRFELATYYVVDINSTTSGGIMLNNQFDIKVGSLFEVWDGELLKAKLPVLQFSKGQLNARVWL